MTDEIDFNIFCPLMKDFCNKGCPAYNSGYTLHYVNDNVDVKPHCTAYFLMGD